MLAKRIGMFGRSAPGFSQIVGSHVVERIENVAPFEPEPLQREDDRRRPVGRRDNAGAGMDPAIGAVVARMYDIELDLVIGGRGFGPNPRRRPSKAGRLRTRLICARRMAWSQPACEAPAMKANRIYGRAAARSGAGMAPNSRLRRAQKGVKFLRIHPAADEERAKSRKGETHGGPAESFGLEPADSRRDPEQLNQIRSSPR